MSIVNCFHDDEVDTSWRWPLTSSSVKIKKTWSFNSAPAVRLNDVFMQTYERYAGQTKTKQLLLRDQPSTESEMKTPNLGPSLWQCATWLDLPHASWDGDRWLWNNGGMVIIWVASKKCGSNLLQSTSSIMYVTCSYPVSKPGLWSEGPESSRPSYLTYVIISLIKASSGCRVVR